MQRKNQYTLVLGSKSPRRKEILGWLDIPFQIKVADVKEESVYKNPRDVALEIARKKGLAVYSLLRENDEFRKSFFPLVVASDTIVTMGDMIYGKPRDIDHAREMLLSLSGQVHEVITAVHIGCVDLKSGEYRERSFACETDVKFKDISQDILESYLDSGESLDKAGSYGIQGRGLTFISSVKGSYSNVVGFPIDVFIDELKIHLGVEDDNTGEWRNLFYALC